MPVAAGLGAHQPNRRLRLAAEPQTGRREVSALTDARKTLAYDFFRILRAPLLGKTNAQYISEYSDYKQYVDEKLDSSLTWDTRLSWTPQFLKQQNLTISADILNVLDSKTAVDTTNTGVATYASGRTFWLDVSMKF
ncbi:TonB-dependent receptor [Escherichia coli]|nr:TonB-dependent receptor [Escherichia coli]